MADAPPPPETPDSKQWRPTAKYKDCPTQTPTTEVAPSPTSNPLAAAVQAPGPAGAPDVAVQTPTRCEAEDAAMAPSEDAADDDASDEQPVEAQAAKNKRQAGGQPRAPRRPPPKKRQKRDEHDPDATAKRAPKRDLDGPEPGRGSGSKKKRK
jgi:hypothetical protein